MKTLCKRIPEKQADIIDFAAEQEDETFASTIKKALNASPVFADFKKQYELYYANGG